MIVHYASKIIIYLDSLKDCTRGCKQCYQYSKFHTRSIQGRYVSESDNP